MQYRGLIASPLRALSRHGWEAEAFGPRRILWRYQSGMFQINGLARAKLELVGLKNGTVSTRRGRGRRARWSCVVVGSTRHKEPPTTFPPAMYPLYTACLHLSVHRSWGP
jgi:hypothetical protein